MVAILGVFISWLKRSAALLAVLALAFALRVFGNGYGLPDQFNIDEVHVVSRAIKFGSGDLNPHFFFYPALYMYVLFFFYGVYFVIGRVIGIFPSAADFGMQYFIDPTMFFLIARTLTAALGTATVYAVAALGTRFYNRRTGLVAALLLAATPLHVDMSHYAVTDVPMTFMIMASLFFGARIAERGGRRMYIAAGLCAGAAMAFKYTAALLVPPLLVAHVLYLASVRKEKNPFKFFTADLFIMGFFFAAFFFIGAPYTLLDFKTFTGDIGIQRSLLEHGWFGMENIKNMWMYSITVYLRQGMGLPLLVVSMMGVVYAATKRNKAGLVLLTFILVFYLFHGRITKHVFLRYWVAVAPALCVLAAALINDAAAVIKIPGKYKTGFAALVAIALMFMPVRNIISSEQFMRKKDTRTLAREWIEKKVPAGARIALEFEGPQLKITPDSLMDTSRAARYATRHIDSAVPFYAYKGRKPVESEALSGKKFHIAALNKIPIKYDIFQTFALAEYPISLYEKEGYDYLIVNSGIYNRYFAAARNYPEAVAFYSALKKDAVLVKEIREERSKRPGPEIRIYKLLPEAIKGN
ncbi:MAG: glycosyltransferase family 39 protein [bacterium]